MGERMCATCRMLRGIHSINLCDDVASCNCLCVEDDGSFPYPPAFLRLLESQRESNGMTYWGYTYPGVLGWFKRIWKWWCCPRGMHLWDEVESGAASIPNFYRHYLYCDACGERVNVLDRVRGSSEH